MSNKGYDGWKNDYFDDEEPDFEPATPEEVEAYEAEYQNALAATKDLTIGDLVWYEHYAYEIVGIRNRQFEILEINKSHRLHRTWVFKTECEPISNQDMMDNGL